jgi:hypothetical protein
MKSWHFSFRVQPPDNTVMGRSGGSVMDTYYDRLLDQWFLVAGGTLEKINEPQMIFVSDEYARQHHSNRIAPENSKNIRQSRKRAVQLSLF